MTTPATEEIIPTAEAKQRSNRELIQEEEKHASSALEAGGENHNDPQLPVPKYQRWRWILVLVAIYVPTLVYGLDNTIVANIQPAIVEDFGSVEKLTFVSVGFSLGAIALNLTVSKVYGLFGNKWVYVISVVMFVAANALCGGAPTIDALIVGRVWAGIGGIGLYLGTLNILSQSTTVGERSNYLAGLGLSYVIGSLCGPVIGGAFVDGSAGWRWAFYLIAIIMGALLPVMLLALDSFDPYPGKPYTERIGIMDHIGALLMAAWVTFFIMAFTFAGAVWAWSAGGTITMFVLFGVFLVSFVVQQAFSILTTTENRLFPVQFLRSRTQILLFVCGAASGSVLFLAIYYVPIYFQFVHGTSGTSSAVHMLPLLCVGVTAVMLNGALMPKFGYYMPWFIASGVFMVTAGGLLVGDVDTNTPNSKMYGYTVLLGLASGTTQQAGYTISQAIVSQEQIPDAVAFMNTAQQGGMVIALAINGAIFQNEGFRRVKEVLVGTGINDQDIRAALAGAKSNMLERLDPGSRKRVIEAIVRTISDGWSLVIVAGGLCLISALLMKREKYV